MPVAYLHISHVNFLLTTGYTHACLSATTHTQLAHTWVRCSAHEARAMLAAVEGARNHTEELLSVLAEASATPLIPNGAVVRAG